MDSYVLSLHWKLRQPTDTECALFFLSSYSSFHKILCSFLPGSQHDWIETCAWQCIFNSWSN